MDNSLALFKNYSFRVIITRGLNGPQNMALDEILLAPGREGEAVLRFYDWRPPTLSLGYFQRLPPAELARCRRLGVPLVRRPTGGRAVFHDDEITYSLCLPIKKDQGRAWAASYYAVISRFLWLGLHGLGVAGAKIQTPPARSAGRETKSRGPARRAPTPWCFEAKNFSEIAVNGKKLVGSAQRLYPYGLLQHGSIIRHISSDAETRIFWPRGEDQQLLATSLGEVLGRKPGFGEVVESLTGVLKEWSVSWEFSDLKREELDLMARLAREKYERLDWPSSCNPSPPAPLPEGEGCPQDGVREHFLLDKEEAIC